MTPQFLTSPRKKRRRPSHSSDEEIVEIAGTSTSYNAPSMRIDIPSEPSKFRRASHKKPNPNPTSTLRFASSNTPGLLQHTVVLAYDLSGCLGMPLVQCPICHKEMTENIINRHLDNNCESISIVVSSPKKRKTQTQAWSRLFRNEESTSNGKGKGRGKYVCISPSKTLSIHSEPQDQVLS